MLQYVAEMKLSGSKELCPCIKKELNICCIQIYKGSKSIRDLISSLSFYFPLFSVP